MLRSIKQSSSYKWWAFGAVAVETFASVVDHGSVAVALPLMARHFDTVIPTAQWIVIGYALAISALLLPMGRLADLMTLDGECLALAGLDGDMALDGWIFAGDANGGRGAVCDVWAAGRRLVVGGRHYAREAVEARFRAVLARLRDVA